jgi:predicted transcriptional regulator of viral defense system
MKNQPNHNQLYEIAETQAGYFTARQVYSVGFSRERLSYYVSTDRFIRIQHGIYRLIQFPSSPYEDLFVAWLRTSPNSVISHESALYVYGLSDMLPGKVHVTIPRTASRRRKDIRLYTNQLSSKDVTRRDEILSSGVTQLLNRNLNTLPKPPD